ncbi:LysR family transcriptional regulator [Pseudooceanicola sp. CBS1P-1]|uniref:LysR family transcriptional regulator n=1 Tax=Pseudooceanicola albus TaxID=2692189 RepID=A0A6L7G3N1_9RHOB|nr:MULTISPECIES: LysR family transcriptional regulator [Pseudooceanicola]MBT9385426.1 LysR family transcriptional regulator [Pseudooceanicola endophyticus]MXN18715.1 LysR family transcriptional regulator [Pseudooceanicola albus]
MPATASTPMLPYADLDEEKLGLITAFMAVCDNGSFAAAAEALRLTPSTVSRKVMRLEERLGTRLFNRTTRRVALTEAGVIYLRSCRQVTELLMTAEAEVSSLSVFPHGLVRITMPVAFGQRTLAGMLSEFLQIYPRIEIEASFNDRFVDMIAENYDLSIRIGKLPDSSLVAKKLASNRRLLVASPAYVAQYGAPVVPSDLAHHECIRYLLYRSSGNIWRFGRGDGSRREETVNVEGSFRCDNSESVQTFALQGLGIGIVADYICHDALRRGDLVRLLPEWNVLPESGIYACWPGNRMLMPKVRHLIDFLHAKLQQTPWDDIG